VAGRHRKARSSSRGRHRKPPQRQRLILPAVAGIAVLGAGTVGVAGAIGDNASAHRPAPTAGSVVVRSVPLPTIPPLPLSSSVARSPGTATLHHHTAQRPTSTLVITDLHSPCYVEVSRHGVILTRTILRAGKELTFRRHGLDVVLGNAGAVRLRINGHRATRPGRLGEVRTLRVK
jgi:hypothetical protein